MDASEEYLVDDPGEGNSQPNAKKKKVEEDSRKVFQHKWLEIAQFQGWLEPVQNNKFAAKCRCCGAFLNCGKSELERHAKTAKHLKNVKSIANITPADKALSYARKSAQKGYEDNVKSMELQLAAYFAEHNTAFVQADHLVGVIKKGAKDSAIVKDVRMGRDKCKAIVKNIIAKVETEELAAELKKTVFSVMVDESTDVSNSKNLCILVKYVSSSSGQIVTRLLEIVEVDARDCSAEALWNAFKACLDRHGIPVTNIVGLACDNANVMVGLQNSFWTRLKEVCPWAILMNCICHTSALISKEACATLPSYVDSHMRSVSTYLNASPKRSAQLRDFQELYEEELQKVLKFCTTRWLVMHTCVRRYLEHRESLLGFFRTTVRECPKDKEAANILKDMNNPFMVAYLYFLDYVLDYFNQFNALFQSRDLLIHKIYEHSQKLMKKLCQNFVISAELERLQTTNLAHPSNFLPLENMFVGSKCSAYLQTIRLPPPNLPPGEKDKRTQAQKDKELKDLKHAFLLKCLEFYKVAATEMRKKLPTGPIFREMGFLEPSVLLSAKAREKDFPDLPLLVSNFQELLQLDLDVFAMEWRTITSEVDGSLKQRLLEMPVEDAWREISRLQDFTGRKLFPQLSKLAHCIMSLPHSNAEAERIFSIVTDVKTKKRNRMGEDLLNAVAVTRSSFSSKGITCSTFQVTDAHLQKFDSSIYDNA